ncbi:Hydroxylysine kinase [Blattella germanica]|nr:Hydroxylysine kinase [Blattella germanica]
MDHLQPGMNIRPNLTNETAVLLVQRLYGFKQVKLVQLDGYDDKNYLVQVIDNSSGFNIWPHGYVLKVMNSLDSQNTSFVEAQTQMALYLEKHGIKCPQPIKNLNSQYYSLEDLSQDGTESSKHIVRMLTYEPGKLLKQVPCTNETLFNIGKFTAKLDQELKDFYHPFYDNNKSIWSLESIPLVRKFTYAVKDEQKNKLVNAAIDAFEREALPKISVLEKGMIHGDINEQNVVMATEKPCNVAAILDLGDTQRSCYVFELAVNLCYMILISTDEDPIAAGGHVIAGYTSVRPLPESELHLLKICICARLSQSLVMGAHTYLQDPGNEYLLDTAKKGWTILKVLWELQDEELIVKWEKIIASYQGK